MKIKTLELIGPALDYAVATITKAGKHYSPSTCWVHGGPIIEREEITVGPHHSEGWMAYKQYGTPHHAWARTPLIASMRCYVVSKLGDEVDVPDELMIGV